MEGKIISSKETVDTSNINTVIQRNEEESKKSPKRLLLQLKYYYYEYKYFFVWLYADGCRHSHDSIYIYDYYAKICYCNVGSLRVEYSLASFFNQVVNIGLSKNCPPHFYDINTIEKVVQPFAGMIKNREERLLLERKEGEI